MQNDLFKTENVSILEHLNNKYKNGQAIYFPGNTPSLKNNKEIRPLNTKLCVCHKKELYKGNDKIWYCQVTNQPAQRYVRHQLMPSDRVTDYVKSIASNFIIQRPQWLSMIHHRRKPYQLGFYCVRDSKRAFDFDNAHQVILDQMQQHRWIDKDDSMNVMSEPIGYHINPYKPCIIITLMDDFIVNWKKERYW